MQIMHIDVTIDHDVAISPSIALLLVPFKLPFRTHLKARVTIFNFYVVELIHLMKIIGDIKQPII